MADKFYLDATEIDEPIGWPDLELSMRRDDVFHGMQFEASTGSLDFYGTAADYLIGKKETLGLKANVTFSAVLDCGTPDEQTFSGRLNFGKYKKKCGNTCLVTIPVEEQSCAVIFASRFDQQVDVDSATAFDKVTNLPAYTNLGQEIEIPAKALFVSSNGKVADAGDDINIQAFALTFFRPTYTAIDASILTTQLDEPFEVTELSEITSGPITPQLLFEDLSTCFPEVFTYEHRMKGTFSTTATTSANLFSAKVKFLKWDGVGNIFDDGVIIEEDVIFAGPTDPGPWSYNFDVLQSGTVILEDGVGYYHVLELGILAQTTAPFVDVHFDPETTFLISATRLCPATNAKSYLIHETLSRVTEAVTNRCMRVKSEYYGRVDSEPFAFDSDGCGGLRMFTSGLKIRRAPEDKFFASPKDLLEGLNGIDNIGFGIEPDPDFPNQFILRVEPVDYFYQDNEMLIMDAIPEGEELMQEAMHYSKIHVGYKKWEVQRVNGLGEPNSNRQYRTGLETISNPKDITSELVTGSYPIEITREQSFALTGAADTAYDNDIFLICLLRGMYGFTVEQGGIDNPANIFDPDTLMNFRLTPVRNLMRWYKSLINSYPNINNSEHKLFFSSGTGNLTAEGEIIEGFYDDLCKLEEMVISESQDLFLTHFERQEDATPLWKNETITFAYYMSIAQYKAIKAAPYGYISYSCGNGPTEKGFVKEIKFKPAKGTCTVNLIKKWV